MEDKMVIEQIGSATFVNGLVRIQGLCAGPDGKVRESGVLEVPGNVAAQVINNLVKTLQTLETQLNEAEKNEKGSKGKSKGNGKGKTKK
jgi:hypothetical protein|tara:strand:+ start:2084 stop:2350 length:267 start_codon:yes stop_codon:yes gene_type:complete